jgi:flagellar hook protein FlgE
MSAISGVSGGAPFLTAVAGVQAASDRFGAAAQATVADPTGVQAAQNIVGQITAKADFTANLKVLKVADEMQKALLDIKV